MTHSAGRLAAAARRALWLAVAAILLLASLPPDDLAGVMLWDKLLHAGAFFALALLADAGYPGVGRGRQWAALMAFGLLIECVQWFLPYRESAIDDLVADAVGVAAYALVAAAVRAVPAGSA